MRELSGQMVCIPDFLSCYCDLKRQRKEQGRLCGAISLEDSQPHVIVCTVYPQEIQALSHCHCYRGGPETYTGYFFVVVVFVVFKPISYSC